LHSGKNIKVSSVRVTFHHACASERTRCALPQPMPNVGAQNATLPPSQPPLALPAAALQPDTGSSGQRETSGLTSPTLARSSCSRRPVCMRHACISVAERCKRSAGVHEECSMPCRRAWVTALRVRVLSATRRCGPTPLSRRSAPASNSVNHTALRQLMEQFPQVIITLYELHCMCGAAVVECSCQSSAHLIALSVLACAIIMYFKVYILEAYANVVLY
jgi:hypothetical protein